MPKLTHIERLNENLSIGAQASPSASGNAYWTARIKFPQQDPVFRSTKVLFEEGSKVSLRKATDKAFELVKPFQQRWERGSNISEMWTITRLGDEYLEENRSRAEENDLLVKEGSQALYPVVEGRGFWSMYRWEMDLGKWKNHVIKYFRQIEADEGRKITLEEWDDRLLRHFPAWCIDNYSGYSPSTFSHWSQFINRLFRYALDRDLINRIPRVAPVKQGGIQAERSRMRREITPEDYDAIRHWFYDQINNPPPRDAHFQDYTYLAYLFTIIIAGTGIRPPTGKTEHTMMKWEDVLIDGPNEDRPILRRDNEKGHRYEALIMPEAAWAFRELRQFYEAKGFDCAKGFCFRHTYNRYSSGPSKWNLGDPIQTFKGQIVRCGKALGMRGENGKQSENLTFSSLRAFFITQRLITDPNVRIEELAEIVGVGREHIEKRYYRFKAGDAYQKFAKSALEKAIKSPKRISDNKGGYKYAIGWE